MADWLLAIDDTVAEAEKAQIPKPPPSTSFGGPSGMREMRVNHREMEGG